MTRPVRRPSRPPARSPLRLDLTVHRRGMHLVVGGDLGGAGVHRLARAVDLLARSPRSASIDLGAVRSASEAGLRPLLQLAPDAARAITVTRLSPTVADLAQCLGLDTAVPFALDAWRRD